MTTPEMDKISKKNLKIAFQDLDEEKSDSPYRFKNNQMVTFEITNALKGRGVILGVGVTFVEPGAICYIVKIDRDNSDQEIRDHEYDCLLIPEGCIKKYDPPPLVFK